MVQPHGPPVLSSLGFHHHFVSAKMVWNSALFLINAFCSLFSLCAHFVYSLKARSQLSSIALVNTRQLSICLCHNPWANTWFSIEMHRGYHHGFPGGHFALEATLVIDGSLGKALMISLHLPLAEQMGTQFTHLRSAQMMYRRRSGDLSHSQFLRALSRSAIDIQSTLYSISPHVSEVHGKSSLCTKH